MIINFKNWFESQKQDYACLLIPMPSSVEKLINSYSNKKIKDHVLRGKGRETESHVTVLFGLQDKDLLSVTNKAKGFGKFELKFGEISKFNHPEFDVIKISIISNKLVELNKLIGKIPHYSTHKGYIPHCTLAYVKKDSCNNLLGQKPFDFTVEVDKIDFVNTDRVHSVINI